MVKRWRSMTSSTSPAVAVSPYASGEDLQARTAIWHDCEVLPRQCSGVVTKWGGVLACVCDVVPAGAWGGEDPVEDPDRLVAIVDEIPRTEVVVAQQLERIRGLNRPRKIGTRPEILPPGRRTVSPTRTIGRCWLFWRSSSGWDATGSVYPVRAVNG